MSEWGLRSGVVRSKDVTYPPWTTATKRRVIVVIVAYEHQTIKNKPISLATKTTITTRGSHARTRTYLELFCNNPKQLESKQSSASSRTCAPHLICSWCPLSKLRANLVNNKERKHGNIIQATKYSLELAEVVCFCSSVASISA